MTDVTPEARETRRERKEREAAEDYAAALRDGFRRDWAAYNAILLDQFSRTAFMRIKRRAWQIVEDRR